MTFIMNRESTLLLISRSNSKFPRFMNYVLTPVQSVSLVLLRLFIGWHFLYEAILKLYNPAWTAKGYLLSATFLKPFFYWLAGDSLIGAVNTLNIAALLIVGISLLVGFKTNWASIIGIGLLVMYYFAHPPLLSLPQGPAEGSYWIINKNLIEAVALLVVFAFPTTHVFGLERLFQKSKVEVV